MTTWPAIGSGSGSSCTTNCSGPPYCCITMARIRVFSRLGLSNELGFIGSNFPTRRSLLFEPAIEEVANSGSNFAMVSLERKVARIVEMNFGVRIIAPERLGAGGPEEPIGLGPKGQERRGRRGGTHMRTFVEL